MTKSIRIPKVSIVIPVYNGSNFLAAAIESALAQTYRNIEVIVVNDGSNDDGETERIALSYGDKIKYYLKKNGGVASALNLGIEKMTGEYFSWLSHDDLYEKTKIEEEVDYLLTQADPANTVVACNSIALFENGIKRKEKINQIVFDNYFDIFLGASAKTGLNGCSLLIPRYLLAEKGRFRENLPVTQDYELWYRLKDSAKFVLLNRNLVIYRHHDMQDSIKKLDLSLTAGDDLRSHILQNVPSERFASFVVSNIKNEKWIWESYATYKRRGYIKTPLAILYLLARYYNNNPMRLAQVRSEVLAFGRISVGGNDQKLKRSTDENALFAQKIATLIENVSDEDYKSSQNHKETNKLNGYIESVKSEGLLFVVEKAVRKMGRVARRK